MTILSTSSNCITQENASLLLISRWLRGVRFVLYGSYLFLRKTGASYSTEKNGGISKPVCGAHCTVPQPIFYSLWGETSRPFSSYPADWNNSQYFRCKGLYFWVIYRINLLYIYQLSQSHLTLIVVRNEFSLAPASMTWCSAFICLIYYNCKGNNLHYEPLTESV